jgi:hypothetical protein
LVVLGSGTSIPPASAQEPDSEVTRLREQVESRRKELREAEDRLDQALRRREPGVNPLPSLPSGERSPFDVDTTPRSRPLSPPSRSLPVPTPQGARASVDPAVSQASSAREDRLGALERKLDRLLKEMEGMRREIEGLKQERGR